jgi:hypothetical protein
LQAVVAHVQALTHATATDADNTKGRRETSTFTYLAP